MTWNLCRLTIISFCFSCFEVFRRSRPEVLYKKGVLTDFAKFTGKHLCHSLFFNKVTALKPVTLLKKRISHRCFLVNFAKSLRTFFYGTPPVAASGFTTIKGYISCK